MLNLLPPTVKNEVIVRAKSANLIFGYGIALAAIALFLGGFFAYNFSQASALGDKESQLTTLSTQRQRVSSQATKLAFIQDRLTVAKQFQEKTDWATLLNAIASDTPQSLQLTDLKVTTDATKGTLVNITGQSTNRRDIVLFQEKLAAEKTLTNVTIQSMTESGDSAKTITFIIQAGVGTH
ncbi:MAG TPA: PilN domain-containing protein [Candidatus Saccharimonadales bacterium]|nr:PilN domain-containing protein [Candidatus Saccharimonadales bacterium]